jgi:sulfonate transport system permease protein
MSLSIPGAASTAQALSRRRQAPFAGIRFGKGVWRASQSLMFPIVIILIWSAASAYGWVSPKILPSPATIADTFWDMLVGGDISGNLGISLIRVAKGFILGGTLGLALGIAMGFSRTVEIWIGPLFRTVSQIPSLVWIPLLMQLFGIDEMLKLVIMVKACLIPIAIASSEGIRNIPRHYLEVAHVLALSRRSRIVNIILPGALPSIFSGLRQGLSHVWASLVIVEMLVSAEGIGYLMSWGRLIFQLDVVIVCMILVGVIGFALDFALQRLEARCLRWRGKGAY